VYIINDEKIKEGDWCLCKGIPLENDVNHYAQLGAFKVNQIGVDLYYSTSREIYSKERCKKIILTSDKDLISDNVQPIDNDFLEWFTKNSTCKFVNTELYNAYGIDNWKYLITIPEDFCSNPETIEEVAERLAKDAYDKGLKFSIVDFIEGIKCQQKRSHSNEEVLDLLKLLKIECGIYEGRSDIEEWFSEFRKV
jgi:hypothetical protein